MLLLSADAGIRVKARARQIEVVAPDDSLAQEEEPDEAERQLAAANRQVAELRSATPDLRLTIDGETHIEGTVRLVRPLSAETLGQLLSKWRTRNPTFKEIADGADIPRKGTAVLRSFTGMPGFSSAEETSEHNAVINRAYKEYEQYLHDWPSTVNRYARIIKFQFVLENSGTAPAGVVHLQLWTDAAGVWLDELPDVPLPPSMPKKRDLFDFYFNYSVPDIDMSGLRVPGRDSDDPNISDDEPGRVDYSVKRVTHHVPFKLSPVHSQFSTNDSIASFSIKYRLVTANIREPNTGVLHVKVSGENVDAPPPPAERGSRGLRATCERDRHRNGRHKRRRTRAVRVLPEAST